MIPKGRVELLPGVIAEDLPLGETLMMRVDTLTYFGLDALATRFWQALQRTGDGAAAVAEVARETGRDPRELTATFAALLEGMERGGLIRWSAP